MRLSSRRVPPVLLGVAALLALPAGASAAYDGGITAAELPDGRPGAVSRPFTIRIAQSTTTPAPKDVRIAVQGLALDPGTTTGRRIGSVDFETSFGPFAGLAITTGGPGDGAPGRWALTVPGGGTFAATVRPGTDLDAAGAPVAGTGATTIGVSVPTDLPFGAKVTSVTVRLNVDEKGCATATPGATNPTTPGSYRVRAFVGASDGQSRVSDAAVAVAADAPAGPALPAGCAAAPTTGTTSPTTGTSPTATKRPVVRLKASTRTVRPGRKVSIRARVTGGPVEVRVQRGSRTLKRLKNVGTSGKAFTFRAARGDAGKRVRLVFRPAGGRAVALTLRVARR